MVQIMVWRRPGDKPLSEPMVVSLPTHICVAWPKWVNWSIGNKLQWFFFRNLNIITQESVFKMSSGKWRPFCLALNVLKHIINDDAKTIWLPATIMLTYMYTAAEIKTHHIDSSMQEGSISITMYSWWRHQIETFSALLAICAGNSPVPGEFPHKGQWRGALMFSLICVWMKGWVNTREAGDLRRYRAHCDVTVM